MSKPLKKHHARLIDSHKKSGFFSKIKSTLSLQNNASEQKQPNITIQKESTPAKPMDPIEAALQLNKLKKDFLIFNNSKTHHSVSIIYTRKNGTYALLTDRKLYIKRANLKKFKNQSSTKKYAAGAIKITKIDDLKVKEAEVQKMITELNKDNTACFKVFSHPETKRMNILYKKKANVLGIVESK